MKIEYDGNDYIGVIYDEKHPSKIFKYIYGGSYIKNKSKIAICHKEDGVPMITVVDSIVNANELSEIVKIKIKRKAITNNPSRTPFTEEKRNKILERFDYICVYCMNEATEIDHIIPWVYTHDDSENNLVASCRICNATASDHVFSSFNEKRNYILLQRKKTFKKPITIWLEEELQEFGYAIKEAIKSSSIVVKNEYEREQLKNKYLKDGFAVKYSNYEVFKPKIPI